MNGLPGALGPPLTGDPWQIPIFVLNFNNLSYLKQLLDWLIVAGHQRIVIIDNNSSYPPLLDFYGRLDRSIQVLRLAQNFGKTALWDAGVLEQLGIEGPFVYTDPDIVPDGQCPADLIVYLASLLNQHPHIFKVGPGLRIDNLPTSYRHKDTVVAWEKQFWRRPVARGLFMAAIDTTFALYRAHSSFALGPSLRTGWPYLARHAPWYADSDHPTEEEEYYMARAAGTTWTLAVLPEWLANVHAIQDAAPRLLHLGCGHELMPGWVNLDMREDIGADIVYDMETAATEKLPLDDDSVDGFFMCHVLEHIEHTLPLMHELHRVAKPGAKLIIRLPHGASDDAFADPTHKRPYFPSSFVYFSQPAYSRADYGYRGDWKVERLKLVVDPQLLELEEEETVLRRADMERNIVSEMIVELSAVKPIRPRQLQLLEWPRPALTASALDEETAF